MCMRMYMCMCHVPRTYACVYVYVRVCVHVRVYSCAFACRCVCVFERAFMYVSTHIPVFPWHALSNLSHALEQQSEAVDLCQQQHLYLVQDVYAHICMCSFQL
jgi:hypothetical protein